MMKKNKHNKSTIMKESISPTRGGQQKDLEALEQAKTYAESIDGVTIRINKRTIIQVRKKFAERAKELFENKLNASTI